MAIKEIKKEFAAKEENQFGYFQIHTVCNIFYSQKILWNRT